MSGSVGRTRVAGNPFGLRNILWGEASTAASLGLAALLGVGFSIFVLGVPFITGRSPYWATVTGDQAQALIGWIAYRHEAWSFPLLDVHSLAFPTGTNLLYTDSIPLFAILAKLARSMLPSSFQYFGYWLALCYSLQSVGMVALLRAARLRSLASVIAGSTLGLASLILLRGFPHLALNAQFLLLLVLAAYLMARRETSRMRWLLAMVGLAGLSLLIHPYFAAMVGFLVAVGLVEVTVRTRQWLRGAALAGIWLVGSVAVIFGLYGFGGLSRSEAPGFGYYSLNLIGPVLPQLSGIVPDGMTVVDATGGQHLEGYAYIGGGVLLLVIVGLVFAHGELADWIRRYWVIGLALAAMWLFALSNVLTFGSDTLATLPLPEWAPVVFFTGTFRSSGRFFWPTAAALSIVGIAATFRRFGKGVGLGIILAALILQVVDARLLMEDLSATVRSPRSAVLESHVWSQAVSGAEVVRIEPSHGCLNTDRQREVSLAIQRIAVELGRPVSTVAAARTREPCPDGPSDIAPSEWAGELVVWLDVPEGHRLPTSCFETTVGVACGATASLLVRPADHAGPGARRKH